MQLGVFQLCSVAHICETNYFQTAERSRLTDYHVQSILKIVTAQQIQFNFEDLVIEKRCQ